MMEIHNLALVAVTVFFAPFVYMMVRDGALFSKLRTLPSDLAFVGGWMAPALVAFDAFKLVGIILLLNVLVVVPLLLMFYWKVIVRPLLSGKRIGINPSSNYES